MKKILITIVCLAVLIGVSACSKEQVEAKSIEQIYKEEGVPVKTRKITREEFKTNLSFFAVMTGVKESTAYAPIGDKIEKIMVKVGDYVKKDSVLLTFPSDSPSAGYFQAKVNHDNAYTAFQRIDKLYHSGGISLQDRDNAKARYDVAKADWDAVRQTIKVKAPISGYVTRIHVSETDNVDKEMPLVTIADTQGLKAAIQVADHEIFNVKTGMPAVAVWQGRKIEGKVVQVDMTMNRQSNSFRALVEFDNPDQLLKAGATAEILLSTYQKKDALVVKRPELFKESGRYFVYGVDNGVARKKEVKTGRSHLLDVEIIEGLKPGEELISEGGMLLKDGFKVKVVAGTTPE